jgi:DegV family protein with EDD domain
MASRVAVVTDSTAYLPEGVADKHGIGVVPLQVRLGDQSYLEGVDLSPAEFTTWLQVPGNRALTSQPAPAAFAAAYDGIDADEIVSVHVSGRLSGTAGAARLAAEDVHGRRIHVVDSRNIAMGLGLVVLAAVDTAHGGATGREVVAAAERAAERTRTVFYVDTLEHLRRGGRMGKAAAWFGSALSVKPLLHVIDGEIAPLEKVRTAAKAIARLEEIVTLTAGRSPVDVAVHHLAAPDRAAQVAEHLRALPGLQAMYESELGPVVGAHVGPGCLGVVVHQR